LNDPASTSTAPQRWRWLGFLAPILILAAAIGYYGSYIAYWFNPHDEGGTAALTALRLLHGEAPIRDVELGYNVGWYWPLVGLFKVAGVNFLVLRGYFFALSTLTALLGWSIVRRVTRQEWLALAVGLGLIVFPGSQFKNYIPLCGVANTLCLVSAALAAGQSLTAFWRRLALGGLILGFTLLVRVDLGYLFVLLWGGFLFLRFCTAGLGLGRRFIDVIVALAIVCSGIVVTHAPIYWVARSGGYDRQFTGQYTEWFEYLSDLAGKNFLPAQPKPAATAPAPAATAEAAQPAAPVATIDRTTLPRVTWAAARASKEADKTILFVLTYLPVLIFAVLLAWAIPQCLGTIFRGRFTLEHPATLGLLLLFGSLATFPQFFYFRPDRPHLSEFMPGYIVATVAVVALIAGRWRWIVAGVLALQFALFGWFALDHYSAGTIAARTKIKKNKRIRFEGANGVHVWVHKEKDYPELEGVRAAVVEHSKPGDWLICYPYQPGYNVMTDRPTYERDLYQDNSTAPAGWSKGAIRRFEAKRPAVVIIDDRPINQVEASRFSVWAQGAYEYLKANYQLTAHFDTIEVYTRKDAPPPQAP